MAEAVATYAYTDDDVRTLIQAVYSLNLGASTIACLSSEASRAWMEGCLTRLGLGGRVQYVVIPERT